MDGIKVVILAGGRGTRLSEETTLRPKPLVEIGGRPILWHIMSIYAAHGFKDFIVACGYKGEMIKEYFHHFVLHQSDVEVDLGKGSMDLMGNADHDWRVRLIDTGLETMTGGRIARLGPHLRDGPFMVTYGDGVADVDVARLVEFHRAHGKKATVTAVHPPARFGGLTLDGDQVARFSEKPQTEMGWINGGFLVFEPEVLDYLEGDRSILERTPLERLSADGELCAFRHEGFWQPMDTLREKEHLEALWAGGDAPWKIW